MHQVFRVEGSGFRLQGDIWCLGLWVEASGFMVEGYIGC